MPMGILALLGGCAPSSGPPARSAATVTAADVGVPQPPVEPRPTYAPAGTRLAIRLSTPISTVSSSAGQTFSAEVLTPVLAADGTVLVAAGAPLLGHVAQIEFGGTTPRLRLGFDTVETMRGPAPLAVGVVSTESRRAPGTMELVPRPSGALTVHRRPAHIEVPAGARIELALTEPLTGPR
jgi:hypothetical protein